MGALKTGWQVRCDNFPPELLAARPEGTESISVTGGVCSLKCAHCGGHYLSKMTPLSAIGRTEDIKGASCLISGGCDAEGRVPVAGFFQKLQEIKGSHRYNFHLGLLQEDEIKQVAPLADVVSFDFVGDDATIRETLKLDKTVGDYVRCYSLLRRYCRRVVPHICIGLRGGRLSGERNALRLLRELGVERLVFIVFMPTKQTEYEKLAPPAVSETTALLEEARLLLPDTELILGCMRPGGRYRQELDIAAVEAGINGIVKPVAAACKKAEQLGLKIKESKECCAL